MSLLPSWFFKPCHRMQLRLRRLAPALATGLSLTLTAPHAAAESLSLRMMQKASENRVAVLTVTQELIEHVETSETCWQTIVSDRERAQAQYESLPWVVKHWKPLLGGVLGGAVGYQFTRNYGEKSQKWFYPTILSGVAVGAAAGPGMVAGAYAGGMVAQHFWPAKLPVTIALSLVGGILGDGLMDLLFPEDPLLEPQQPGQYVAEQEFYVETRCMPTVQVTYTEKPYRATYRYQGELRSALFKYDPGDHIQLNADGRPVSEQQESPLPTLRMRTISPGQP